MRQKILRFLHRTFVPSCTFDSANGLYGPVSIGGEYYYRLHCKCGAVRRFYDAASKDKQLADVLFKELGLDEVMAEVDRGL